MNTWYQGRKGVFFPLYIRRANACKPVLLALQLEKKSQVAFKDWLYYQWDFFCYFSSLFWAWEFTLTKLFPSPPPCSLFSLYQFNGESINYCFKNKRGHSQEQAWEVVPNTILLMTHMQQSWHSYDKFTPKNVSVSVIGQCPKCLV